MTNGKQQRNAEIIACIAILIVVAIALLTQSCGGLAPLPPGPPVPSDADAVEQCDAICDRLDVLGCPAAAGNIGPDGDVGNEDDASCERVCLDYQEQMPLDADCIVAAGTCAAANACEPL